MASIGKTSRPASSMAVVRDGRSRPSTEGLERPLRVAMVLPGLGRVRRGAETAFFEIARGLSRYPDLEIELFGSGVEGLDGVDSRPPAPLHRIACVSRDRFERWPGIPPLRSEYEYEELTFTLGLWLSRTFDPRRFDAVLSCTYPFVNWYLQKAGGRRRPRLIFVTQNGDWMARARNSEYRFFRCDGLVCTNQVYYEQHRERYRTALIPNGVDLETFRPRRPGEVEDLSGLPGGPLPTGRPLVLVASALIASKNVAVAIEAAARRPEVFLVIAGDGPERGRLTARAEALLPDRHRFLGAVPRGRMPALYRRADAFSHLSCVEPSANVYLEAAGSGLPEVVDDNPVTRQTLGEAALYVDASDAGAVAEALGQALEPEIGSRLGREARSRMAEGWGWEVRAGRYRDFLREICRETPCSRS